MFKLIASLALITYVAAIQVTAPTNTSGWETSGSHTISWNSVSTDPSNFTIQLYTPSSPNTPQVLAQNVQTSDGTYTWTPSSDLAAGDRYRINLYGSTDSQAGILAQSDYFEVTQGGSSASSSASASSSSSASASASSSAAASASSASSGASTTSASAASSASSAAASASKSGSAGALAAPGGLLLLIAGAVGAFA